LIGNLTFFKCFIYLWQVILHTHTNANVMHAYEEPTNSIIQGDP